MGNSLGKDVTKQWNDDLWLRAQPSIRYFIPVFGHPIDARSFIREADYTSSDDHIFGTFIMTPSHQPLFEKMSNQELLDRFGVFDLTDYKNYLKDRGFYYTAHGTSKKRKGNEPQFGSPRWLGSNSGRGSFSQTSYRGSFSQISYSGSESRANTDNIFPVLPLYDDKVPLLTVKQLDISTTINPSACLGISTSFLQKNPKFDQNPPLPETVSYLRLSALTPHPNDPGYIEPIFSEATLGIVNTRAFRSDIQFLKFFGGPIFGIRPILPPLPLEKFSPVLPTIKSRKKNGNNSSTEPTSDEDKEDESLNPLQSSQSPQSSRPLINNSNYNHYEYPIPVCYNIEPCYQYDFTPILIPGTELSSPSYPLHLATILLIDLTSPFGQLTFYSFIRETVSLLSKGSTLPLVDVPIFILTMGEQHLDDNNAVLTEHSMRESLIQLGFSDISFYNSKNKTNKNSLEDYLTGPHSGVKPSYQDPLSLDKIGGRNDLGKQICGLVPENDFRSFAQPIHDYITLKHFEILSQGHFDRSKRFLGDISSDYERPAPNTHALLNPSQTIHDIGGLNLYKLESEFSLVASEVKKNVLRHYTCLNKAVYVEHPCSPAFLHRWTALRAIQMFFTILRSAFENGIHPLQLSTSTKPPFSPLKPIPSSLYYIFKEYHEQFFGPKPKWIDLNGPNGPTFIDCSRWSHSNDNTNDDDDNHSSIIANPSLLQNRIPFLSNPLPDYFMRGYQERVAWLEETHGYKTPMGYLDTTTHSNAWLSTTQSETSLANNAGVQFLPRDIYYRNPYDVLQDPPAPSLSTTTTSTDSSTTTTTTTKKVLIGTLTTTSPDFLPPDQLPTRVNFESLIYISHDYLFSLHGYPDEEQCPRYAIPTIPRDDKTKSLTFTEAIKKAKSLNYSPSQDSSMISPGVTNYLTKTSPEKGNGQLEFFPDWRIAPGYRQYSPEDMILPTPSTSHIAKRREIVSLILQSQFGQFSNCIGLQQAIKIWKIQAKTTKGTNLEFLESNPFPTTNFHKNHSKPIVPTFLQQLHPITAQQLSHFHTTSTHKVPANVIGHQVDVTMTYTTHSSWNVCYERDFYETTEVSDEMAQKAKVLLIAARQAVSPPPRPVPFWLPQYRNNGIITPLQYVHSVVILPFAYSRSPALPLSPGTFPPIPSIGLPFGDNLYRSIYALSYTSTGIFKLPPGLLQSHSPVTFLILCMNPILEEEFGQDMTIAKNKRDVYEVDEDNDCIDYSLEPIPQQQFDFFQNNMPRITKYELIYRQFTQFAKSPECWIDPQRLELLWDVQFIHNDDLPNVFKQLEQTAVANRLKMLAGQR